ncbi:MAG TPA: hypothetical protein VF530_16740 [Planctomycetota bacterium]
MTRLAVRLVCAAFLAPLACGLAAAQSLKLSGDLAHEVRTGAVTDFRFDLDGSHIVYRADRAAAGVFELFGVPSDGSGPSVRLNSPLPPGSRVAGFTVDSRDFAIGDGERVLYVADQTVQGIFELYAVPSDGSASPVRLSPALEQVYRAWLVPGGGEVVYVDAAALRRVPIDASAAPSVVCANPTGFVPFAWQVHFSPDGSTLVFHAPLDVAAERLYAVPLDGSAPPVQLHESEHGDFEVPYFDHVRFASDGVHLLYDHIVPFESYFLGDLFSTPLDGSQAPAQIDTGIFDAYSGGFGLDEGSPLDRVAWLESGIVYSAAYDGTQRVALTPGGWTSSFDRVVVDQTTVLFGANTGTGTALLRAPLDGSASGVPLFSPALTHFGFVRQIEIVAGTTVVFLGDLGFRGLYTVPLAGGTPVLLNPPVLTDRGARSFQVHPNGQELVFLGSPGPANGGLVELFAVPMDGSQPPRKLNGPIVGNGDVASFEIAPDGLSVAYRANPTAMQHGVFRAPLDGLGPVLRLNEPTPTTVVGGDVLAHVPTPDGTRVLYLADGALDERFELYATDTFARGRPRSLSAALPGNALTGFAATDERAVFQVQDGTLLSLCSASLAPGSAPIVLATPGFALPLPLALSPDGARVVYRERTGGPSEHVLRSALLDGSAPPVTLHPPLPAGRTVADFALSPDGARVVFRSDRTRIGEYELFSVPLDGSAAPVRLHGPLAAGRWVWAYEISADSAHVVLRANLLSTSRMEAYSVPIAGGAPPRRLNDGSLPNGGLTDFVISADGRTVAYRASTVLPSNSLRQSLFHAPIDGHRWTRRPGAAPRGEVVRLTELTDGSVESDFRFGPGGAELFYRSNPGGSTRRDLFRVPADGGAPPVQLSEALATNRTVSAFELAPGGTHAVYLADALANDVFELFSVPLTGGPVVALDPLPAFADVSSFRIDPRAARVVYLADRNLDGQVELFAVPLDGSRPPQRLSGLLPAGGDVESDLALLPLGRVLYRADQGTNDVLELFASLTHTVLPR